LLDSIVKGEAAPFTAKVQELVSTAEKMATPGMEDWVALFQRDRALYDRLLAEAKNRIGELNVKAATE
jgi:hypothetical protein